MGFKLFSSKSSKKLPKDRVVPETSHMSIMKIKDNLEVQEKREEHIKDKIKKLEMEAKSKMAKGDKRGALFAMKKRKLFEGELSKIENVKMTLETQIISLEGATSNIETMNAMSSGNAAMKTIRQMFGGVSKVDDIMDDVRDEIEMHREVEHAFSQPIDPCMGACADDDLLAELEALDMEDTKTSLSLWPTTPYKKPTASTSTKTSSSSVQQQQQQPQKQAIAISTGIEKRSKFALFG